MRYTSLLLTLLLCGVYAEPLTASSMVPQQKKAWKAPARKAKVKNAVPYSPEAVKRGRQLYVANCVACHGDSGKGDGAAAVALNPKPADLSLPAMQTQTDGTMYWKLSKGRAPMPAFDPALTDVQRWELVHYLRSLGPPPSPEAQALNAYGKLRLALEEGKSKDFRNAAKGLQQSLSSLPGPSKWEGLKPASVANLQKTWSVQMKQAVAVSREISAKDFDWEMAPEKFDQLTQGMASLLDLMPTNRLPFSLTLWKNTKKDGHEETWLQWSGKGSENPFSAERRKNGKAQKTWKP